MSTTSRQIVLGLGLAGLLVEAIVSHPAFAVDKVKLFKVVTPDNEIVIGLTKTELEQLPGKNAPSVAKVLNERGKMRVWQYGVRRSISGEFEQAPLKQVALLASAETKVEPYATQLRVVPITEEKMTEAEGSRPLSSKPGTYLR